MKDIIEFLAGDRAMVRRYLLLSVVMVGATFAAAQGVVALLAVLVPEPMPRYSAAQQGQTRVYTVTRSVLDDQLTTGSIPRPGQAKLDPCRN
ncbi:MAG: hypothetical protein O9342_04130 [Beijerinckiaceae bacterium]|nr:hypothetical protein [Beijerinckiaceae bacterium]